MLAIYCINLPNQFERRARIIEQMAAQNLEFEFVEGVNAAQAIAADTTHPAGTWYDAAARARNFPKLLSPAEQACVFSHARALEQFLASEFEQVLVIEDNAQLASDTGAFLSNLDLTGARFDCIRLQYVRKCLLEPTVARLGARKLIASPCTTAGTSAIIYSRVGAEKMLRSLRGFLRAFDTHFGQGWRYNLSVLTVSPSLIIRANQQAAPSVIDSEDKALGVINRTVRERSFTPTLWMRNRWDRWTHETMKQVFALKEFAHHRFVLNLGGKSKTSWQNRWKDKP